MGWIWSETPHQATASPPILQQHTRYGAACRKLGLGVAYGRYGPANAPQAQALMVARRLPLMGAVGLVTRGPFATAAGQDPPPLRGPAGLRALLVTPDELPDARATPADGAIRVGGAVRLAEMDLAKPEEQRRAALHGKWRNRLRRAAESGLTLRFSALPPDPSHWLLQAEAAQQKCKGYRGLPPAFSAAWAAAAPDGTLLAVAEAASRPVAAMLFLLHPPGATYQIGWSDPTGRARNAHNLLLWESSRRLAEMGCHRLELGKIDADRASGLERFKLGTGASVRTLPGTWLRAPGTGMLIAMSRFSRHD